MKLLVLSVGGLDDRSIGGSVARTVGGSSSAVSRSLRLSVGDPVGRSLRPSVGPWFGRSDGRSIDRSTSMLH